MNQSCTKVCEHDNLNCYLRVFGGKGGFGSMLRAIGAQIEKTTNREACRDLSGRRLRDINKEKRIKRCLKEQKCQIDQPFQKRKKKIEKLLAVSNIKFKDEQYEKARSNISEKVNNAVEAGLNNSPDFRNKNHKRANTIVQSRVATKKTKNCLWIDVDSDSDVSTANDSDVEMSIEQTKQA